MVLPRLIHPVPCTIKVANRSATLMDEDTREPIQRIAYRGTITVPGQPRESIRKKSFELDQGGRTEGEGGYILCRTVDLDEQLITVGSTYEIWANSYNGAVNDRITQIGNQKMNAFISRIDPLGTYTNSTLVKVYYSDRGPARATGGAA